MNLNREGRQLAVDAPERRLRPVKLVAVTPVYENTRPDPEVEATLR